MDFNFRKIGLLTLFLTLFFFKVSALHVYTHELNDHHDSECALCEISLSSQLASLDFVAEISVPENLVIVNSIKTISPFNTFTCNTTFYCLYGRPPPSKLS